MLVIDTTYFLKPPVSVPQSNALGNGVSQVVKTSDTAFLTDLIDLWEPIFYRDLLGKEVADEFIGAYKASKAEVPVPLEPKWQALISNLFDATAKKSPCANYIYFQVLPELDLKISRNGVKEAKLDCANLVASTVKGVNAWNLMVDDLRVFYAWLLDHASDYEHDEVTIKPKRTKGKITLITPINAYGI